MTVAFKKLPRALERLESLIGDFIYHRLYQIDVQKNSMEKNKVFLNKVLKQLNSDIEQQPKISLTEISLFTKFNISLTQISLFTKFNSAWVVKLHVKCRLLEENGKKSTWLGSGDEFLHIMLKKKNSF